MHDIPAGLTTGAPTRAKAVRPRNMSSGQTMIPRSLRSSTEANTHASRSQSQPPPPHRCPPQLSTAHQTRTSHCCSTSGQGSRWILVIWTNRTGSPLLPSPSRPWNQWAPMATLFPLPRSRSRSRHWLVVPLTSSSLRPPPSPTTCPCRRTQVGNWGRVLCLN